MYRGKAVPSQEMENPENMPIPDDLDPGEVPQDMARGLTYTQMHEMAAFFNNRLKKINDAMSYRQQRLRQDLTIELSTGS